VKKYCRGDKQKAFPVFGKACNILIVQDQPFLSGNGFASPLPIKTIQVLAITALIAAFAFIPDLYVVVVIIVVVIEMQN
jgi:hypothetical protein